MPASQNCRTALPSAEMGVATCATSRRPPDGEETQIEANTGMVMW
ncbi:hypothetical protein SCALM49S_00381 [Streptomyces californicus]